MDKQITTQNGNHYNALVGQIGDLLQQGRQRAAYAVNNILVQTYWQVGKYIVEFEQGGEEKSEYGSKLLDRLSKDLTAMYGKGFSRSNLMYIRKLYIAFPIGETVSHQFDNDSKSISETEFHQLPASKIQTLSGQIGKEYILPNII